MNPHFTQAQARDRMDEMVSVAADWRRAGTDRPRAGTHLARSATWAGNLWRRTSASSAMRAVTWRPRSA